jgi:hypothetical protein
MSFPRSSLSAILSGSLLGATVYLWIAMGSGNVPWAASDYAILAGLTSIPLSWFSVNKFDKYGIMSTVAGVIFTTVALPIYFLCLFAMGLPGNEAPIKELLFPFLIAPTLVSVLFITRKPQSVRAVGLSFFFSFLFFLIATQSVARLYIQSAIEKVQADGGCVLVRRSESLRLDWRKIKSIWEIPFGVVIGHASSRVSFVTPSASTEWTYGKMKEVPSKVSFTECGQ